MFIYNESQNVAGERDREMKDCHDWHHVERDIFQNRSGTDRFTLYLLNPCWDPYFRTFLLHASQPVGCLAFPPSVLSTHWLLSELLTMWLSCHYIIFGMLTYFSFPFPIHVNHFHSTLFTQVQYPVFKSLTNQSIKG